LEGGHQGRPYKGGAVPVMLAPISMQRSRLVSERS